MATIETQHIKIATTDNPVMDLVRQRWSPRAFTEEAVRQQDLNTIFEAMSWTASAFNEQPWRVIVGVKGNSDNNYENIFNCLVAGNQEWAKTAPVLMLMVGKTHYTQFPDNDNGTFKYDCGQAAAFISLQAMQLGLYVHQMGGILPEKAVEIFNIPEGYQVLTGIALGHLGKPELIDEKFRGGETAERIRKPLQEIIFGNTWGETSNIVK